jgi:hypothetical protein
MIFITKKEYIDEYWANPNLSQSQGKALEQGPRQYLEAINPEQKLYYEEPKDFFILGSAVDCWLTQGKQKFEEGYYISTCFAKPSEKQISIIRMAIDRCLQDYKALCESEPVGSSFKEWYDSQPRDYFYQEIINSCDVHDYQRRWGSEARWKGAMEGNDAYVEDLIAAEGKQIITSEEYDTINMIVENFRNHPALENYIGEHPEALTSDTIHVFMQLPIYFDSYNGHCKALLDMVIVDTYSKRIIPFDFKTSNAELYEFPGRLFSFGYDIQAAWYSCALRNMVNTNPLFFENSVKDEKFHNYYEEGFELDEFKCNIKEFSVENFKFAVAKVKSPNNVHVFTCSSSLLAQAENGHMETYMETISPKGQIIVRRAMPPKLGVKQLITLYQKYIEQGGFDVDYRDNIIRQNIDTLYISPVGMEKATGEPFNPYQALFQ